MNSGSQTPNLGGRRLRYLAETLQETMTRYGYELVETPIVQPAELFLTKAGDRLVTRLFTFERHGRQMALRPEFTTTAAYDYVHRQQTEPLDVARWQYSGPIFIEEATRAGLDYPHYSVGAELIGLPGPLAEAEIMAMAVDGIVRAGLSNWHLRVGHVGLMRRLLARFNLDGRTQRVLLAHLEELKSEGKQAVLDRLSQLMLRPQVDDVEQPAAADTSGAAVNTQQMLDALLDATQRNITMGGRTRHDIVRRLLQKRQRAADYEQIVAAVEFLTAWGAIDDKPQAAFRLIEQHVGTDTEAIRLLDNWRRVVMLLEASGIPAHYIRIQPDLARSWDYYTGVVFEVYAATGEHVAGGGRYDELTALVGGQTDVPSAGFVFYPDQILAATNTQPDPSPVALRISSKPDTQPTAIKWAQRLRSAGQTIILLDGAAEADAAIAELDDRLVWRGTSYTLDRFDAFLNDLERA